MANQKAKVIINPNINNSQAKGQRHYFESLDNFGKLIKEQDVSDLDSEYDIKDSVHQQFNQDILYTELDRDDQDFMSLWNQFMLKYNEKSNVKRSTSINSLNIHSLNGEFLKPSKFIFILDEFINENFDVLKNTLRNQFLNHICTLIQYCIVTPNQFLQIALRLK
ncbi:hypothetical protein TTHERM_00149839 (macronuclear) [Tetrahymena thermophila SB210]|uniref:Polycomb protein VEFS-Box domain-containing protein n=2 Tax=Tetrahymena thermophila TaxID=5911 RepID=A4VD74_TETTS|nr:hypothetical protein TTHERM_00149839 [Tetrahymena thermophila SB210]ADG46030.1 Suz12p [Tetrahymena thermophila]EDK31480.1 hypothetical protein TTHERM_00149839 [Tetrahymena thermophila SB210]|eukprot:XP_001470944.1 hypothetical protein TTHERM_00149839 [Tetrahymena thermophila SB210]